LGDREIVIVSYSRGASVVLSALSDPAYDPDFEAARGELSYIQAADPNFFQPPPLVSGGPIRIVMFAPAIGNADFWGRGTQQFRRLPERVVSIRYSINPRDGATSKYGVARRFNSTALGADRAAGEQIDCHYRIIQGYSVTSRFGHGVSNYIADDSFARMFGDSGVPIRGNAEVVERPIERRPACSSLSAQQ
jgi:hypothetical protein